jgi:hypothetical protein
MDENYVMCVCLCVCMCVGPAGEYGNKKGSKGVIMIKVHYIHVWKYHNEIHYLCN